MLNLVACKSSSEGTFLTKQLIVTIVMCGMLRVNKGNLILKNKEIKIDEI